MLRIAAVNEPQTGPDAFDDFWLLYPKRVAKKDAKKAWAKIPPSMHNQILTSLVAWRKVWAEEDVNFLPHPSTYLNGERWEDELPADAVSTHASHAAAVLPTAERGEMPAHVAALLAKLRAGRG